jgi:hypothetical protein
MRNINNSSIQETEITDDRFLRRRFFFSFVDFVNDSAIID